jgi:hypothetical protein
MTSIAVDDAFVPGLRAALLTELSDAASTVSDIADLRDTEAHRAQLDEALRRFDAYRAAYVALGWGDRPPELDRFRHGWAITTALQGWLSNATYALNDDTTLPGSEQEAHHAQADIAAIQAFVSAAGLEVVR